MKRNFLNQFVLCFSLIIIPVVMLLSCKKDELTELSHDNNQEFAAYDYRTSQVVQRIKNFDSQLKKVKQGVYRSNDLVNVDSAMWNIESLFNIT